MICSSTWFTSWGVWKMRKMLLDQVSIDQKAKAQFQISAMEAANSWAVFASSVKILWSPWEGRYFNKWKDRFYTGSTPLFSAPFISRLTYSSGFRVEMTGQQMGFIFTEVLTSLCFKAITWAWFQNDMWKYNNKRTQLDLYPIVPDI